MVSETLMFLDCICGSTTGELGLLGLYINEHNASLINQTLETLTEYCQGPCHENQNCIATHESNGLDIITALLLTDINPLGQWRMDLVLELKNNASKLLLAVMESRGDSENAERILYNMNPKQLVDVACRAFHQKAHAVRHNPFGRSLLPSSVDDISVTDGEDEDEGADQDDEDNADDPISFGGGGGGAMSPSTSTATTVASTVATTGGGDQLASPREVGHNIYILCHQLAKHNKDLAALINPNGVDNGNKGNTTTTAATAVVAGGDPLINQALEYYGNHTAQIEVHIKIQI